MFIELHQTNDGLPVFVNSSHIQCIAEWQEKCSFIYFDSDHWLEVTESYDEIKMMLTDRVICRIKEETE